MRRALVVLVTLLAAVLLPYGVAHAAAISGPQFIAHIDGDPLVMKALPGDLLAVGGNFSKIGGTKIELGDGTVQWTGWRGAHNLAVINPANGAIIYTGNLDGYVRALTYLDGVLYVGGDFTGRTLALRTSDWTRTSWAPGVTAPVRALERAAGRIYVATSSYVRSTNPSSGARQWEATATGGPIRSLLAAAGHVYVGGMFDKITDPGGSISTQPNLQAVDWATGSLYRPFRAVLRANKVTTFDGENALSLRLDPYNSLVLIGIGSGNGNYLRSVHYDTGAQMFTNRLTTGDVQSVEVVRHLNGAVNHAGFWHNNHGNELTRFYGAENDPATNQWTDWNPGLSGDMAGNGSGGNGGVQASAIVGPWLVVGGQFTNPISGLARYRIG